MDTINQPLVSCRSLHQPSTSHTSFARQDTLSYCTQWSCNCKTLRLHQESAIHNLASCWCLRSKPHSRRRTQRMLCYSWASRNSHPRSTCTSSNWVHLNFKSFESQLRTAANRNSRESPSWVNSTNPKVKIHRRSIIQLLNCALLRYLLASMVGVRMKIGIDYHSQSKPTSLFHYCRSVYGLGAKLSTSVNENSSALDVITEEKNWLRSSQQSENLYLMTSKQAGSENSTVLLDNSTQLERVGFGFHWKVYLLWMFELFDISLTWRWCEGRRWAK